MGLLSHLLKPVYGETLTSWMSRLASAEYIDEEQINKAYASQAHHTRGDLDVLYQCDDFMRLLEPKLRDAIQNRFKLPAIPLLSFASSDVYCPRCLKDDVAAGIEPAWRISWRIQGACLCELHESPMLLSRLDSTRFTHMNKGWIAFGDHINSPASRLSVDFALTKTRSRSEITSNRILLHLIRRVQRWKNSQVERGLVPQLSPLAGRYLMYVWLWQNVDYAGACGFARQYFRPMRGSVITPSPRKGLGLDTLFDRVDMQHVGVAYLLLGIAYGVISPEESELVREITFSVSWIFPVNRHEVGACGRSALGREALEKVREEVRDALGDRDFQLIAWALDQ